MQFTILSRKVPTLNDTQFRHEFQVVHAEQTKAIARNLGIIHEYEQGLALATLDQPELQQAALFPTRETPNYQAFARLTWPSLEVMEGSFTTEDYRRSAGEHIFAQPFWIFLTQPLGQDGARNLVKAAGSSEGDNIRVIIPIQPRLADGGDNGSHFEEQWDEHASFVRSTGVAYTRHRSLQLPPDRLAQIFDQTQFDHRLVMIEGGYEEFAFGSRVAAEDFFKQYAQKLQNSYEQLLNTAQSEVFVFSCVTQFAAEQRGWWQLGAGLVVGTALRMKILLGR
ncbi:hypothetical protein ASPCAL05714 [Aspergillus calidoustus]|uniref:EthD domain-containing protein n=1 Tax=Aspergillus calidoustus TaxID=454130 RepID=A0A0U5C7F9_ASPCI|nr:hypothetical protein ASPCAL05714 [Aspergillus calidoustus]